MQYLERYMTIPGMLLTVWIVIFAVDAMAPISDPDTPWHIATGLYIIAHHHVPTTDPFSWSAHNLPWVTQEWLFEVVLAWLSTHLGFTGCWLLLVVVHTFTVIVIYRLCCRVTSGHRVVAAVAAIVSTLVAWPFWVIRPQIVSYLLFAVFMLILQRVKEGKIKTLWFVPPLMLIWANAHGSASIGIVMLFLEVFISFFPTLGRLVKLRLQSGARWRILLAAVAGALVGMLNPNGIKEFTYALLSTNQLMVDSINEWHSPSFHGDYYKYGVLSFLVITFFVLLMRRRSLSLRQVLYFGGSFAMTLIYQRFLPYMALAAAPLIAEAIADIGRELMFPSRWMRWFCGAVMLVSAIYLGTQLSAVRGSLDSHMSKGAYPVDAVNYLKKHPISGRLLNAYNFGGYLVYRHIPTFVDGRTDIFLQGNIFSDYMSLQNLGWNAPALLDTYNFHYALLPPGYAITVYLNHDPSWHIVYQDNVAEILERNTTH